VLVRPTTLWHGMAWKFFNHSSMRHPLIFNLIFNSQHKLPLQMNRNLSVKESCPHPHFWIRLNAAILVSVLEPIPSKPTKLFYSKTSQSLLNTKLFLRPELPARKQNTQPSVLFIHCSTRVRGMWNVPWAFARKSETENRLFLCCTRTRV
jgi:hypothetical protein